MEFCIEKKFQIYNSLSLNLGYDGANDIGHLIPILGELARQKLHKGEDPIVVVNEF